MRLSRQARVPFGRNDLQQLLEPRVPLCSHNAELGQMRPQGIDLGSAAASKDRASDAASNGPAALPASRPHAHDSGSVWLAAPSP